MKIIADRDSIEATLTQEQLHMLIRELQAIEHWDTNYYAERHREILEIQAFKARQARRKEILRSILKTCQSGSYGTRNGSA